MNRHEVTHLVIAEMFAPHKVEFFKTPHTVHEQFMHVADPGHHMCIIDSAEVGLAGLRSSSADYVAVTVNMSGFRTTGISAYVWKNAQWDTTDISTISARCPGRYVIYGDFSAHHGT